MSEPIGVSKGLIVCYSGFMRVMKFIVSGISAAGVEYAIFLMLQLTVAENNILLSQTVSFLSGFFVSFSLNKYWVFSSSKGHRSEIGKYAVLAIINLILTNSVIYAAVEYAHIAQWLAKLVVMAMVASWNYVIFSRIIFGRSEN